MQCKNCGSNIEQGEKFCSNCGHTVETENQNAQNTQNTQRIQNTQHTQNIQTSSSGNTQSNQPPQLQYCSSCGSPMEKGSVFCPNCGTNQNDPHSYTMQDGVKASNYTYQEKQKGKKKTGIIIGILITVFVLLIGTILAYTLYLTGVIGSDEELVTDAETGTIQTTVTPTTATPDLLGDATQTPGAAMGKVVQPTPSPTPTPSPAPTSVPAAKTAEHSYVIVISHVSWDDAKNAAEQAGGHLVTFSDQAEFDKVTSMFSDAKYSSVKNVWIGACAPTGLNSYDEASAYWNSSQAAWITGEPFTFKKWRTGEPSGYDANIGAAERYIQIFKPAADGGVWSYNDAGDDLSEYKENTLAYVIEYEN